MEKILVIGACGQIGTELTMALREKYGWQTVIAADLKLAKDDMQKDGLYVRVDVLDKVMTKRVIARTGIRQVYHLAAMLSAAGERNPAKAWDVNMQGLLNVLEACRESNVKQLFWPSSTAVFGQHSFEAFCPQNSLLDPATVYGISKAAGEYWCQYYHHKFGLDVRSLRYPGLVSYLAKPGGGTTDYAVDIFHEAFEHGQYKCFLRPDTTLPMLYMPDAIRATLELMSVPTEKIKVRTSYNLSGMSFSPLELAAEIKTHVPKFKTIYEPDFRQAIADTWPSSIDDHQARHDWGWKPEYNLKTMTADMVQKLALPVL